MSASCCAPTSACRSRTRCRCGSPPAPSRFPVALHALRRAGDVFGKRVLITGAGPIGLLCLIAARAAGAAELVITDIADEPLAIARAAGATETINAARNPEQAARYEANKGYFDVMFEATGIPQALAAAVRIVAPGGRIVQLGMLPAGETAVAINLIVAREIDLLGSFRFHEEFHVAVASLASGLIDVSPILSAELPLARATEAFELAGDRKRSIKVHLAIG